MKMIALALAFGLATGTAQAGTGPHVALDADFPDPALVRAADGNWYAYATQGKVDGASHNIQLARSTDLVNWTRMPDALPVKPAWASATQDFWAPHVSFHKSRYYLYYSAKPDAALKDDKQGLCLAVATSSRPEGPFTDIGKPLLCGPGFENIDPMVFDDPATDRPLLYWGSGFGPIKVQALAPDRISFRTGSKPVALLDPVKTDDPANYSRLIEGAWVVRHGGWHYLFYSGDNCCGEKAHYATLVARSRKATGPFVPRMDPATGQAQPVIAADDRWLAPGHNAVVRDGQGRWWTAWHAIDRRRDRTTPQDGVNSRRIMLTGRLVWRDGWPELATP